MVHQQMGLLDFEQPQKISDIIDGVLDDQAHMGGGDRVKYPEYWRRAACRDWYEADHKMWMCLSDKNAICEIDKTTKKVRVLGCYPQKEISKSDLSAVVIGNSAKIVFVPLSADDIAVYDRTEDKLIFIPVKKNYEKHREIYQENMKFRRAFAYGDYVFLLGYSYPAIIQLNINTLETNYLTEWISIIEPYIEEGDSLGYFKEGYSLSGSEIYLPLGCCGGLLRFELEKTQFEYIPIKAETKGFGSLTDVNGTYYMTGRSGKEHELIVWNQYTGSVKKIEIPAVYYYAPIVYNDKILLFSFNGDRVIVFKDTFSFMEYKLPESFLYEKNALDIKIMAVKRLGKLLKFQTGGNRKWHEFDPDTNAVVESEYRIEDDQFLSQSWNEYCDIKMKEMLKERIITETLPTEQYLMQIVNMWTDHYIQKNQRNANGDLIWDYLKTL